MKWSAQTFIFMEDANSGGKTGGGSKGYNMGSWVVTWTFTPDQWFNWEDPPAMYHGNIATTAFADGHSEFHKWVTGSIIQAAIAAENGLGFTMPPAGTSALSPDQNFVHDGYRFPGWK